jgi:hypothetical protein
MSGGDASDIATVLDVGTSVVPPDSPMARAVALTVMDKRDTDSNGATVGAVRESSAPARDRTGS